MCSIDCLAKSIGYVSLLYALLSLACFAYKYFIRSPKNLRRYGKYAVVTGSTDGIGKAYCFELAKRGLDLIMISRNAEKLEDVKKSILEKYSKCEIQTLVIDFAQFNEESRKKVTSIVEHFDVGVLINNVGMSYPFSKYLMEVSDEFVEKIVDLNVMSTTFMTRLVLPAMINKRKGAIINISSIAACGPMPLLSLYSATKSYIVSFSESLACEYASHGIDIQCQVPAFVVSKLSKIRKESLFVCSPRTYAVAGSNSIGYEKVISPY